MSTKDFLKKIKDEDIEYVVLKTFFPKCKLGNLRLKLGALEKKY